MKIGDCEWYIFGTKGLRRGSTEIKYLSDQLIGLFLPGGMRKEASNLDSISAEEKLNGYNFFINCISPGGADILRACEYKSELFHLCLPVPDVEGYVDHLLNNVTRVNISSPSHSDPFNFKGNNIFAEKNRHYDSVIILIFFSSQPCVKLYLKLLFKDIFHR